jgi:pyruvate,orthophosphate dikinase
MARGKKVAKGGTKKKTTRSSAVRKKAAPTAKKNAPAARKKAVAKKKAATKKKAPAAKKKATSPARKKTAATAKRKAASGQYVFGFGGGKSQGRAGLKNLLGGKGANLAEMASLGFPVPPGFTISTEVCT